uniref:Uncharacterized protein n=1 Tax=Junco hyemalis TaxID=40217 RepID=A0A8C5IG90_JUNHY
ACCTPRTWGTWPASTCASVSAPGVTAGHCGSPGGHCGLGATIGHGLGHGADPGLGSGIGHRLGHGHSTLTTADPTRGCARGSWSCCGAGGWTPGTGDGTPGTGEGTPGTGGDTSPKTGGHWGTPKLQGLWGF